MHLELEQLQILWYIVLLALVAGYTILDGFDLGVGTIHLFSKSDEERRILLNAIGPLWDGNEVWLVTAGGALFAGFPAAFGTVCSSFYDFIILFVFGLIFRAIAIEVRSKEPMKWWRWGFDILFSSASFFLAFGFGVLLGNLIGGIPLDSDGEFTGTYRDLIGPYPLLTGCLSASLFTMHGAIFALMKTEGRLHDAIRSWINPLMIIFLAFYGLTTCATLIYQPHMTEALRARPYFFLFAMVDMAAIGAIPHCIYKKWDGTAFFCSCFNIALLITLFAIGSYPNLVRAVNDPLNHSLTIFNSSSSSSTLSTLLTIAILGSPMVIGYTIAVYRIFHGKVKLDSSSY